jgi:hypothetical protein
MGGFHSTTSRGSTRSALSRGTGRSAPNSGVSRVLGLQRSIGNAATSRLLGSVGGRTTKGVDTSENGLVPEAEAALQSAFDRSGRASFNPKQHMYRDLPLRWQTRLLKVTGRKTKQPTGAAQALRQLVQAVGLAELATRIDEDGLADDHAMIDQQGKDVERSTVRDAGLIDLGPASPDAKTFAEHYGFRLDAQEGSLDTAPGPRLDVRSTYIGSRPLGIGMRSHLFLVYTSEDGAQRVLRGGPGAPVRSLPYGYARADVSTYHPDHVDWDPSAPSVTVAEGNEAKSKLSALLDATRMINAKKVPYDAIRFQTGGATGIFGGDNCNTIAWTLLDKSGLPKRKPSGLHPGWGHELGSTGKGNQHGPGPKQPPRALRQHEASQDIQLYKDALLTEKAEVLKAGERYFVTDDDTTNERGVLVGDKLRYLDSRRHKESRHVGKLVKFDGHQPGAFYRDAGGSFGPVGDKKTVKGVVEIEVLDVRYLRGELLQPDDFVEVRVTFGAKDHTMFVTVAGILDPTPAPKPLLAQGKPPPPNPPPRKQPPGNQPPPKLQPEGKGPDKPGGQPRPLPQPPGKAQAQPQGAPPRPPRPDRPIRQPMGRDFEVLEHTWTKPPEGEHGAVGMVVPGTTVRVIDPTFDPADTAWIGKDVRILVKGVERRMPAKALMPKVST